MRNDFLSRVVLARAEEQAEAAREQSRREARKTSTRSRGPCARCGRATYAQSADKLCGGCRQSDAAASRARREELRMQEAREKPRCVDCARALGRGATIGLGGGRCSICEQRARRARRAADMEARVVAVVAAASGRAVGAEEVGALLNESMQRAGAALRCAWHNGKLERVRDGRYLAAVRP